MLALALSLEAAPLPGHAFPAAAVILAMIALHRQSVRQVHRPIAPAAIEYVANPVFNFHGCLQKSSSPPWRIRPTVESIIKLAREISHEHLHDS